MFFPKLYETCPSFDLKMVKEPLLDDFLKDQTYVASTGSYKLLLLDGGICIVYLHISRDNTTHCN